MMQTVEDGKVNQHELIHELKSTSTLYHDVIIAFQFVQDGIMLVECHGTAD